MPEPELLNEIATRQSRRALSEATIPEPVVTRLVTAATYAPSCFNNQPWRLMVLTEEDALNRIRAALTGGNYWAKKAPAVVLVATKVTFDAQLDDNRDYALFGCGLATQNLLLQATKEGLYAHPMAGFNPLAIKQEFHIPADYIVACLIALGYPGSMDGLSEKHLAAETGDRVRKPDAEVICRNAWTFD